MGLYSGDLDRFGCLASAKFRAARMVLDAGIHTRWVMRRPCFPQQSAVAAEVRGEINQRLWPGQVRPACSVPQIPAARRRQREAWQPIDLRAFHDQVLRGNVTTGYGS
jgi:uncharacterized protein (DUF885 family)